MGYGGEGVQFHQVWDGKDGLNAKRRKFSVKPFSKGLWGAGQSPALERSDHSRRSRRLLAIFRVRCPKNRPRSTQKSLFPRQSSQKFSINEALRFSQNQIPLGSTKRNPHGNAGIFFGNFKRLLKTKSRLPDIKICYL